MNRLARIVIVIVVGISAIAAAGVLYVKVQDRRVEDRQNTLAPFYSPPAGGLGAPGDVLRLEPLGVEVAQGEAFRMLYVSERPDGTLAESGGMIFIPESPAPVGGRPVVAWAHGTVGMADQCAPSRSDRPLNGMDGWLEQMMSLGWVVVATDYVGLGTNGIELFLVGEAEARDVVNSVRAARNLADAAASERFVVWGHSQGGHSSLWTGHLAAELAPELVLLGAAAAAPAAELVDINRAQWDNAVGWAIGPEVAVAWPSMYPDLRVDDVVSESGRSRVDSLSDECIQAAAFEGLIRSGFGQKFFSGDPTEQPDWAAAGAAETPPPMPADLPVIVAQGTADKVVLAWPNAMLQQKWCENGSTLSMLWLGGVDHASAANAAGPSVVTWIADRFADRPAARTCDVPPPVSPSPPG